MANYHCSVCKKPSELSCSICSEVYYCSREHQIQDWRNGHKKNCFPFKVATNEILGRHLIAIRDIPEGDMVLRRRPLIICPKIISYALCLGCHSKLNSEEEFYRCSKCYWPLCGLSCENTELHKDECEVMSKNKFRPQILPGNVKQSSYSLIGPLRVLLLKTMSRKKFDAIMTMQSHLETHKNSQLYAAIKKSVVPILIDTLKLDTDEKEILTICSVFDTNAFDVKHGKRIVNVRALYRTVSLMSHDCKQNTRHYYSEDNFEINVSSTVPIKKGEIITTCYTQSLWGTLARRAHLKQAKNFDCSCDRCKDPTEFGLYVGSIYCVSCRENDKSESCPKMVSTDPLVSNANLQCQECHRVMTAKQLSWGNDALRKEMLSLDKTNPQQFEAFLDRYANVLHPSNGHALEVKYALSQMYGNLPNYNICDMPNDLVQRKIDLCRELLAIADILCPGSSRFRGSLLYDLQAAMVIQSKREYDQDKVTKQSANDTFNEAVRILQESTKILSVESDMKDLLHKRMEIMTHYLKIN